MQELYSEKTNGPLNHTTVFLHGNLASHAWWEPIFSLKKNDLNNHLKIDWRGCGKSPYWKENPSITIDDLCTDITQVINNQLGSDENFVLVGHSLGGLLAAFLATKFQSRVKALYLLDPVGPKGVKFGEEMYQAIESMGKDRGLTEIVILSTIYNENLNPDLKQQIVDHAFKAVKNIGREILETLKNVDIREDLKNITAKTRVVWGEHDKVISKDDCQLYAEYIKNCEFAVINNQGHCWNVEDPDAFLKDIEQFIN